MSRRPRRTRSAGPCSGDQAGDWTPRTLARTDIPVVCMPVCSTLRPSSRIGTRLLASKALCPWPNCWLHRPCASARCSTPQPPVPRENSCTRAGRRTSNPAGCSTHSTPRPGVGCSRFLPTQASPTRCATGHISPRCGADSTRPASTSKPHGGAVSSPVLTHFRRATTASCDLAEPFTPHGIIARSQANCDRSSGMADDSKMTAGTKENSC